jgi:hypothetical protein
MYSPPCGTPGYPDIPRIVVSDHDDDDDDDDDTEDDDEDFTGNYATVRFPGQGDGQGRNEATRQQQVAVRETPFNEEHSKEVAKQLSMCILQHT